MRGKNTYEVLSTMLGHSRSPIKDSSCGRAWWLTPVIPALWEAEGGWIMRSRDRYHPGQHGETRSLLKIQKLAGRSGTFLWSQLLGKLRRKNRLNPGGGGCSEQKSHHCTPAWVTEEDYLKKEQFTAKFNIKYVPIFLEDMTLILYF